MSDDVTNEPDLQERLKRLSKDLGTAEGRDPVRSDAGAGPSEEMLQARSKGLRVLGEFSAAIVAGLLIGYFIDRVAGTSPACLIIFLILGMAAGFLNIYRAAAPPGAGGRR